MRGAYLDGDRVYRGSNFKASLLKHHDGCVVDTGPCGKQTGWDIRTPVLLYILLFVVS